MRLRQGFLSADSSPRLSWIYETRNGTVDQAEALRSGHWHLGLPISRSPDQPYRKAEAAKINREGLQANGFPGDSSETSAFDIESPGKSRDDHEEKHRSHGGDEEGAGAQPEPGDNANTGYQFDPREDNRHRIDQPVRDQAVMADVDSKTRRSGDFENTGDDECSANEEAQQPVERMIPDRHSGLV